jgi:hypothetical protein
MGEISKLLLLVAFIAAAPVQAATSDCPAHEPGELPWLTDGSVPGDLWAWVYLELDSTGRPERCLMGANNIDDSDLRFFVCRAAKEDWHPATADAAKALASTTVKRHFVLPGPRHNKGAREAKKQYFAEHSDIRPECYPDD